ncbi:MAG: ARPP-1 family domain-containing protein [Caulobacterales bacterium]
MADALAAGTARVEEINEGGLVPTLRLINDGEVPVLAFDGEELVGAKQNRVLSVTILAPPHATLSIPVACVEQGRWRYKSRTFAASEDMLFAKARAKKARAVRASVARRAGPNADQGEIWSDIADKYAAFRVEADTSAMSDVFENAPLTSRATKGILRRATVRSTLSLRSAVASSASTSSNTSKSGTLANCPVA